MHDILQEQLGYDLHRIVGDNHTVEYRYDYMTDIITDEAASIISSHNTDKPMYLQLAHLAPHSSDSEDVMEVRDWEETNATLGYIRDLNRKKYASKYNFYIPQSKLRFSSVVYRIDRSKILIAVPLIFCFHFRFDYDKNCNARLHFYYLTL